MPFVEIGLVAEVFEGFTVRVKDGLFVCQVIAPMLA